MGDSSNRLSQRPYYCLLLICVISFLGLSLVGAFLPPLMWHNTRTDFDQAVITISTMQPMKVGQNEPIIVTIDPEVTFDDVQHFEVDIIHLNVSCAEQEFEFLMDTLTIIALGSVESWIFEISFESGDRFLTPAVILCEIDYHLRFNNGSYTSFWSGSYTQGVVLDEDWLFPLWFYIPLTSLLPIGMTLFIIHKTTQNKSLVLFIGFFTLTVIILSWFFLFFSGIWLPFWFIQAWPPLIYAALALVLVSLIPFAPPSFQERRQIILFISFTIILTVTMAIYGLLTVSSIWYQEPLPNSLNPFFFIFDRLLPLLIFVGLAVSLLFTLNSGVRFVNKITSIFTYREPFQNTSEIKDIIKASIQFLISSILLIGVFWTWLFFQELYIFTLVLWNIFSIATGLLAEPGERFIGGILSLWDQPTQRVHTSQSQNMISQRRHRQIKMAIGGIAFLSLTMWLYSIGIWIIGQGSNLVLLVSRQIWFVAVVLAIIKNGLFNTAIVIGLIIGVLIALYRIGKT